MSGAPPIDPGDFRELCGRFATGVVIVTAASSSGSPAGMTANSFTSVSLQPPLISVNIDLSSDMCQIMRETSHFGVNILEVSQEWLSRRFALSLPDRFANIEWCWNDHGIPVFPGCLALLECETIQRTEIGDHLIIFGRVTGGSTALGDPLLYFRGEYL